MTLIESGQCLSLLDISFEQNDDYHVLENNDMSTSFGALNINMNQLLDSPATTLAL